MYHTNIVLSLVLGLSVIKWSNIIFMAETEIWWWGTFLQ